MKLFKSSLRRTGAVVAGSVLGLASIAFFAGPASAHHSILDGKAECVDAKTGAWKVVWELEGDGHNGTSFKLIQQDVSPAGPKPFDKAGEYPYESNIKHYATQNFGGDVKQASLTVKAAWSNNAGERDGATKTVTPPTDCTPPSTPPTTTPPASESPSPSPSASTPETPELPGEPQPVLEITCDTITIGLDNPADGIEIDMKFETSKGEVRETTVAPGEKKSETFSATDGFTVDWTLSAEIDGKTESFTETIPYTQPDDCEPGQGGGLPVTGAAAGGIAGGAGALLVVGAGLFLMARRRKVKFTA